ncbi:MAG: hypothetical protein AB7T06_16865 [Kofleriaceae bacterium]
MPNEKNDKYEEIENNDLQTPGVDDDDDLDIDDGMDVDEPDTVGSRHVDDPESGKNLGKDDDDMIPQDSDPSE